ncbi:RabGAP/TBC [Epithele typhae]|uniref:RabGAP/TBC n=1 Tax=Epithele typhae TaxID=378194 RepID=UPI002008B7C2|nr:RabGAP/TBC [Epithele typhae]KAH9941861.1 RabGAP/TBC [Epithele typhae]
MSVRPSAASVRASRSGGAEVHRQREQRWVQALASTPPAQARKSKKVRKMVVDGVPASVQYMVWAMVIDSRAKRMDGLYQKLADREKVAAAADIERDIRASYADKPELQDGSLAKLLKVYLTIVPDVTYSRGLVLIAAQLLMQSPEEDAFWIFVALMESHLRPYFFSTSVQLEVDASLFGRAVEANEPVVAKKLFGDMGVKPIQVIHTLFTTAFVDALPPDYVVRLWDVFLFDGVSFLFRAGIALFTWSKEKIMQCTSPDAALDMLFHPTSLPANPDAFIDMCLSVKLKDSDLQKQRSKIESQVRRRTAQARPSPISPTTPATIY